MANKEKDILDNGFDEALEEAEAEAKHQDIMNKLGVEETAQDEPTGVSEGIWEEAVKHMKTAYVEGYEPYKKPPDFYTWSVDPIRDNEIKNAETGKVYGRRKESIYLDLQAGEPISVDISNFRPEGKHAEEIPSTPEAPTYYNGTQEVKVVNIYGNTATTTSGVDLINSQAKSRRGGNKIPPSSDNAKAVLYQSIRNTARRKYITSGTIFTDQDIEIAIQRSNDENITTQAVLEQIVKLRRGNKNKEKYTLNTGSVGIPTPHDPGIFDNKPSHSFKLPSQDKHPRVKDVSPVNKDEEAILNIQELAQELTDIELKGEVNAKKEQELLDKYLKIILKHERTKKE